MALTAGGCTSTNLNLMVYLMEHSAGVVLLLFTLLIVVRSCPTFQLSNCEMLRETIAAELYEKRLIVVLEYAKCLKAGFGVLLELCFEPLAGVFDEGRILKHA